MFSHVLPEALRRGGWNGERAARRLRGYQSPEGTRVAVTCQLLYRLSIDPIELTCRSKGLNAMIARGSRSTMLQQELRTKAGEGR